jgi:hypothetical protein
MLASKLEQVSETVLGLARGARVNMDFLFRLLQIVNKKKDQKIEDRHPMLEK